MKSRKLFLLFVLIFPALGLWLTYNAAFSQASASADLSLHKGVTPLTALAPGEALQYTLVFSNAGVLTATEVVISDTLPGLLTDVTVTGTLPFTPTKHAWEIGTLEPGAGGIITVTARVLPILMSELTFTNTAIINTPITDTQPANNSSFVVSEVNLPPLVNTGPNQTVFAGEPVTFNATFTDPGLEDTHSAVLTWGDGFMETLASITSPLTATHVYTATGVFTMTLQVTDSDGGTGEDRMTVTVAERVYARYLPLVNHYFGNPMDHVVISPLPNSILLPSQFKLTASYGFTETVLLSKTVTTTSVILHSSQSGEVTGTLYVEGNHLTLTPARFPHPGETFQATLTTAMGTLLFGGGETLHPNHPTVWQFQAGVSGGSGYLGPANSPVFGSGASTDLALGDLDGDGDWDVLVTNQDAPSATVWVNDGVGHFSPHPTTPEFGLGGYQAVALGDLDRDGDLDAVFATFGAETVWLNDGAGNFSPHPTAPIFGAETSQDVALGDVNGDGFLDALVASTNGEPETVWLNDGTGAFFPHPMTPAFGAEESTSIALGDVDGDFDLDALVANTNGEPETVWLNDGQGNFSPHPTAPTFGAGSSQAVRLGDVDADGDVDAVVANTLGEAETVWLNDGTGGFSPPLVAASFGMGDSTALALGDLDGDGDVDVVVANANDEPETLWLNDGTGGFSAYPSTPWLGAGDSHGVVLGDLNGDWDLEVVVANNGEETMWASQTMKVVTTLPAGNGSMITQNESFLVTFDHPVDASTVNTDTFAVRGDFTGKYPGTLSFPAPNQVQFVPMLPFLPGEMIVVTLSRLIFSQNELPLRPFTWSMQVMAGSSGAGNLTFSDSFSLGYGHDISLGDLDGDRDLDMVVALYNPIFGGNGASIWLNEGDGNYIPHPTIPILTGDINTGVVFGDLDDDGDLDALFAGMGSGVVYLNDGTGGLVSFFTFPIIVDDFYETRGYVDLQLADLDGDGDLDAVGSNTSPYGGAEPPRGIVWLNDGTGQFYPHPSAVSFGLGEVSDALALFDMDQDGDLDIVSSAFSRVAILWLNQGAGHYMRAPIQPDFGTLNFQYSKLTYGDLDGDQDVDILAASVSFDDANAPAAVWLNDGAGHFALHPTTPRFGGGETECVALSDLDGDGDLDAIFVNFDQLSTVWVNDGLGNFTPHPTMQSFGPQYGYFATSGDIDGDGDMDIVLTGATAIIFPQAEPAIWVYQNE